MITCRMVLYLPFTIYLPMFSLLSDRQSLRTWRFSFQSTLHHPLMWICVPARRELGLSALLLPFSMSHIHVQPGTVPSASIEEAGHIPRECDPSRFDRRYPKTNQGLPDHCYHESRQPRRIPLHRGPSPREIIESYQRGL